MTRPPQLPPDTEWISPGYQGDETYDPDAVLVAPGQVKPAPVDERKPLSALTAAVDVPHDGAMIALVPSGDDLKRLAVDGGEPVDELHLTLLFLGMAADYTADDRAAVVSEIGSALGQEPPILANGFGAALWNPDGETPSWVMNVGDNPDTPGLLADAQDTAAQAVIDADVASKVPDQHSPWAPHVCLAYSTDPALLEKLSARTGPIRFDTVRVAFGDEVHDVMLKGEPS